MNSIRSAALAVAFGALSAVAALPSMAAGHDHNGGSHDGGRAGLGVDIRGAGGTPDTHREFLNNMNDEDKEYVSTVCKIPYAHRTAEEKQFCIDIGG